MPEDVSTTTLRRFNRTYTQRIGALDESFLGTGRPLNVSRLLFEIGPDGATVRELRDRLDLDSGYVTRLLRRLTDDGLVDVHPDPADRRRRVATGRPADLVLLDSSRELVLSDPDAARVRTTWIAGRVEHGTG